MNVTKRLTSLGLLAVGLSTSCGYGHDNLITNLTLEKFSQDCTDFGFRIPGYTPGLNAAVRTRSYVERDPGMESAPKSIRPRIHTKTTSGDWYCDTLESTKGARATDLAVK